MCKSKGLSSIHGDGKVHPGHTVFLCIIQEDSL